MTHIPQGQFLPPAAIRNPQDPLRVITGTANALRGINQVAAGALGVPESHGPLVDPESGWIFFPSKGRDTLEIGDKKVRLETNAHSPQTSIQVFDQANRPVRHIMVWPGGIGQVASFDASGESHPVKANFIDKRITEGLSSALLSQLNGSLLQPFSLAATNLSE